MSSILEALRELEGERPPAARREIPPPERPPGIARRTTGALIPVMGGLAVGIVAFGLYAWGPRLAAHAPADSAPIATAPAAPATSEPPAWLDTADAPRARVSSSPAAPARARTETAAAEPAREPERHSEPAPSSSGGQVAVESISYSENVGERVATMRFRGRRVTVRQRESIDGIEVQLIMPNGVYVQHGAETYMLPLSR